MISISDLPAVNATLNATSAVFLLLGYGFVRRKKIVAHRVCMGLAVMVSAVFIVSYLIYHHEVGVTRFTAQGWIRSLYFIILTSHTILATVTALMLVPVTVTRAFRGQVERHKKIARWTLPIWLYVSITGVIIYLMLYHWYVPEKP